MYSAFQLAKKYFKYYLTAANGKGHGIHSPFVFDFVKFVLNDRSNYACYQLIELLRKQQLKNKTVIEVEDFGAGSTSIKTKIRAVNDIAASSLKPKKYSQLLFRIVQYYKKQQVLELGTSLGITTAYLASANNHPFVTTMEGAANIAQLAQHNFTGINLQTIELITGNFETTLPQFLHSKKNIDFAFLDGNHRKIPTLNYFEQLLNKMGEDSIMVFDDIHWSKEMEEAWALIQQHEQVTLTIDLFFIGIIFFRKDFKVKQHFTIRF